MAEKIFIEGVRVVDTFDVPMSMTGPNDTEIRYHKGYQGVVLEDGRKLIRCLEQDCTWTGPADKSPGGHKRVHRITASTALREFSVGDLVDALTHAESLRRQVETLQERLNGRDDKHAEQIRKIKEHHQQKMAELRERHKDELKQARDVNKEERRNWRKRATKAEGVLSALSGYVPPAD